MSVDVGDYFVNNDDTECNYEVYTNTSTWKRI